MAGAGTWQEDAPMTRVIRIARAPEGTAAPDAPNIGDTVNWDGLSPADWVANPFEFTDEDFTVNAVEDDALPARGAGRPLKRGVFRDQPRFLWNSFQTTTDDVGEAVIEWAKNFTKDGNEYTPGVEVDRHAIIVEYEGLKMKYMPSVEIHFGETAAGKRRLSRGTVLFDIMGTEDLPEGQKWIMNQAAE